MMRWLKLVYKVINTIKTYWFKKYLYFIGVKFGVGLALRGFPYILSCKKGQICLGSGLKINSGRLSNPIGLNHQSIIRTISAEARIIIGNNVSISGSTILARKKVRIGDNVMIGANCTIIDSDQHPILFADRVSMDSALISNEQVYIKNGVWLGMNVIVLKGVVIGENTVVGAGSVVSRSLPPNVVAAGNPAKVIRHITN